MMDNVKQQQKNFADALRRMAADIESGHTIVECYNQTATPVESWRIGVDGETSVHPGEYWAEIKYLTPCCIRHPLFRDFGGQKAIPIYNDPMEGACFLGYFLPCTPATAIGFRDEESFTFRTDTGDVLVARAGFADGDLVRAFTFEIPVADLVGTVRPDDTLDYDPKTGKWTVIDP